LLSGIVTVENRLASVNASLLSRHEQGVVMATGSIDSLRGVLGRLLGELLQTESLASDHSIHAARRTLKRARAALRLMRAGMAKSTYRSANRLLRDAARPLTPVRDSVALLDALDVMRKPGSKKSAKLYAFEVYRALQARHRAIHARLTESTRRRSMDQVRSGRRAFFEACEHPRTASLHECRKQAKYLVNEMQLAQQLLPLKLEKARRRAGRLAELLGKDHDLSLLREMLRELPAASAAGKKAARRRLVRRIERKRRTLQRKAHRLGKRLYNKRLNEAAAKFQRAVKKRLRRDPRAR
jgi:CHAD domain-containing protein